MAENPTLADMGTQKISVSEQTNSLQFTNFKSDSFVVDMERLSHLTDKDITANSRFTLQRNLSRKLSQQRGSEKKINPSIGNENDNGVVSTSSPRATLAGASTPEKPMVVTVGTSTDQPKTPHLHHQITIMTGNIGATTTESRGNGKRFSFRRSPYSWAVDPRRIVFFFATFYHGEGVEWTEGYAKIEEEKGAVNGREDYTQDGTVDLTGKPVLRSKTERWTACSSPPDLFPP